MRISPSHLQTDACSLKLQSSRDALIVLSFSSRGRGRRACRMSIHMRSRVRWCRWLSCGGFPVLCARDPEASLRILRFLADQLGTSDHGVLKRYDRRPKRRASRKLYMLQGLPGVGPALAHRLLLEFGCVERVVTADEEALMRVRGVGREKAARIRDVMR